MRKCPPKNAIALQDTLKKKKQAILFLNRRGMSTFVSCRSCGFVSNCPNCEIPLIHHLHEGSNFLHCHHCQRKYPIPNKCPACQSLRIKYFGAGVEKIESEVKKIFPKTGIKRVDSSVLTNHADYEKFYSDFYNRKFDIVIGTQILARGFDIPNVSLVGVISADVGLHLPYFRASEKIFRLLTQVSGRSGRREGPGRTIIQSYWPNSTAIKFAAKHDFKGYYQEEIKKRKIKNYPPFSHIIRILSEHSNQMKAKSKLESLALELEKNQLNFIGPGQCFFYRLRNKYRYQLLIKIKRLPNEKISDIHNQFPDLIWDVDPVNLL
jgi:primosomal protein N' (replication factor Y)